MPKKNNTKTIVQTGVSLRREMLGFSHKRLPVDPPVRSVQPRYDYVIKLLTINGKFEITGTVIRGALASQLGLTNNNSLNVWIKSARCWGIRDTTPGTSAPILKLKAYSVIPGVDETNLTTTLVYYSPLAVVEDTGSIAGGGAKVGYTWPLSNQIMPLSASVKSKIVDIESSSLSQHATLYINVQWAYSGSVVA